MVKKIIGYFLLLLGVFSILSILGNVVKLILGSKRLSNPEPTELVMAIVFAMFLGFICFKYGIKWTSRKKAMKDDIDAIGNEQN
ncbi:MAG: hypothetical protein GYB32_06400 [Algicola sp.]|nr:hypothetical protein [Algicola sp.]